MATFEQNLAKIRGQAVYGPDMREAIAEAIEQTDDAITSKIAEMETIADTEAMYADLELIEGIDYKLILGGNV